MDTLLQIPTCAQGGEPWSPSYGAGGVMGRRLMLVMRIRTASVTSWQPEDA